MYIAQATSLLLLLKSRSYMLLLICDVPAHILLSHILPSCRKEYATNSTGSVSRKADLELNSNRIVDSALLHIGLVMLKGICVICNCSIQQILNMPSGGICLFLRDFSTL